MRTPLPMDAVNVAISAVFGVLALACLAVAVLLLVGGVHALGGRGRRRTAGSADLDPCRDAPALVEPLTVPDPLAAYEAEVADLGPLVRRLTQGGAR